MVIFVSDHIATEDGLTSNDPAGIIFNIISYKNQSASSPECIVTPLSVTHCSKTSWRSQLDPMNDSLSDSKLTCSPAAVSLAVTSKDPAGRT